MRTQSFESIAESIMSQVDGRSTLIVASLATIYLCWLAWSQRSGVPLAWILASALGAGVAHMGVGAYYDTLFAFVAGEAPVRRPEFIGQLWMLFYTLHVLLASLLMLTRAGFPERRSNSSGDDTIVVPHGD